MSGWGEAVAIVLVLTGRASPLRTSVALFPGLDLVCLKNSARSRRIPIGVAQQPAKALPSLQLTMVPPHI